MTMDELQGSLNYAIRKCFTDARYKIQAPVTIPKNDEEEEEEEQKRTKGIGQKPQSKNSGKQQQELRARGSSSPRGSPRKEMIGGNQVITARPYHSVKDEEGGGGSGSGGSNSDEIIVMDDDDDDFSGDEIDYSGEENGSLEF